MATVTYKGVGYEMLCTRSISLARMTDFSSDDTRQNARAKCTALTGFAVV
jgi:hypothetical protein